MVKQPILEIESGHIYEEYTPKILLIYTGGTLGMAYDRQVQSLVPMRFETISQYIPELGRLAVRLSIVSLDPPIDSSDMQPEIWLELANIIENQYTEFDGFVILHGTDTMAFTASALSFLLENLKKPIVLTGAQLSIGIARSDARENMLAAIELAAAREANEPVLHEVCIYFNGHLLRGNRAKKYESSQFDAFQSENYPNLAEVGVYIEYNKPYFLAKPTADLLVHKQLNSRILIIKLFPGISMNLLRHILSNDSIEAVVLETYGSGNAGTNRELLELIGQATKRGVIFFNVSQCVGGEVHQQDYAAGIGLSEVGVVSGKDITTEAAVCKLMFLLGQKLDSTKISTLLEQNLRGEMAD